MLDDVFSGWDRGLVVIDAHAAYERGDYRTAAQRYEQAVASEPDNGELATRLASALLLSNRYEEAIDAGRRAMELADGAAAPAVYAAGGALGLGDLEQAEQLVDTALEREPTATPALLCKAEILQTAGDEKGAAEILREARRAHPGDAMVLVEVAGHVRAGDGAEEVVRDLRAMSGDETVAAPLRAMGMFALGSLLERLEDYDGAYRASEDANAAVPAMFDSAAHERAIDEIIGGWTRERFERLPTASEPGELPIFIIGMPRTGSTLVEQILACHPEVHAGGEMPQFAQRAGAFLTPPLGAALDRVTRDEIDAVVREHLDELAALAPGAERVTDKLLTNFLHVGVIRALFPDAAIIHCTRRALDTALSCWQHNFRGALGWSNTFEGIAAFYRGHDRVMAHWRDELGISMLHVPYEELVREPEEWSRKLVEHAGLPWNARCLKPHENKRAVLTSSREQVREPVHTRASGRADRYGALLDPLRAALEVAGVRADG